MKQFNKANAVIPLDQETRTCISTHEAAHHIGREPQTLREWACRGTGLVRPVRVGRRLAWPVADIRKLLGVA